MRLLFTFCIVGTLPFILKKTKRRETCFLFVCYLLAVVMITLGFRKPFSEIHYRVNPLHEYVNIARIARVGSAEAGISGALQAVEKDFEALSAPLLNILLFMPFGYMVADVWPSLRKWWWVLFTGLAFSLLIETTQLITHLGWFDTADLMNNTLGAMLGYLVYCRWVCNQKKIA